MTNYTRFTLRSGAVVMVESSRETPRGSLGPAEASTAGERIGGAWSEGAAVVGEVGGEVVEALRRAFSGVEEVTVEFGANISGKTGVILVEGSVAANLKVTVKWKAPKEG